MASGGQRLTARVASDLTVGKPSVGCQPLSQSGRSSPDVEAGTVDDRTPSIPGLARREQRMHGAGCVLASD
jgi:hypothetical protein